MFLLKTRIYAYPRMSHIPETTEPTSPPRCRHTENTLTLGIWFPPEEVSSQRTPMQDGLAVAAVCLCGNKPGNHIQINMYWKNKWHSNSNKKNNTKMVQKKKKTFRKRAYRWFHFSTFLFFREIRKRSVARIAATERFPISQKKRKLLKRNHLYVWWSKYKHSVCMSKLAG